MNLPQRNRKRGAFLTPQGWYKLQNAKQQAEDNENNGKRFTLESYSSRTGLDTHTLCKIFNRTARVDQRSLVRCFLAFSLLLESGDYEFPPVSLPFASHEAQALENNEDKTLEKPEDKESTHSSLVSVSNLSSSIHPYNNRGAVPDVSAFHGRIAELGTLHQWIQTDRCRVVALSGQGGIGKTCLAAKIVEQIQDDFEYVFWQSLHPAPSVGELLIPFIQFVSQTEPNRSQSSDYQIAQAIDCLRSFRCLLVFDNVETILQGCNPKQGMRDLFAGHCCPEYEEYRVFLKQAAETDHHSCLLLTSRELPQVIRKQVGKDLPVRSLPVKGLEVSQIQKIFQSKGDFLGTAAAWNSLVEGYAGNPLILKSVARTVQFLFGGNIAEFLNQNVLFFGEVCHLLDQQLDRLSEIEMDIMIALTLQCKPVSFSEVRSQLPASISSKTLLEGLNSLDMRSLLEIRDGSFSLLPFLASYVTERHATEKSVAVSLFLT